MLTFRQATQAEQAEIMYLFKEAAENLQKRGINQWQQWLSPTQYYIDWVAKGINNAEYYFVEKDNTIAGMFRLMYTDDEYWGKNDDSAAYVHSLVTLPHFKGQNIGTEVLQMIENQLIKKSIQYFRLDCKADNTALCDYYHRQGFAPVRLQVMPHYTVQLFEKKLD
jgi:protein-tyrosine phosphatase